MIMFLDQRYFFNPADLLSKYHLPQESVEALGEKAKKVFKPEWLQTHPKNYVNKLFEQSQSGIRLQTSGSHEGGVAITENSPDLDSLSHSKKYVASL